MSAQLMAITREVSPSINRCELLFYPRQPIDVAKTIAQHKAYQDCLSGRDLRQLNLQSVRHVVVRFSLGGRIP